jgi:hypothetical protein
MGAGVVMRQCGVKRCDSRSQQYRHTHTYSTFCREYNWVRVGATPQNVRCNQAISMKMDTLLHFLSSRVSVNWSKF